MKLLMSTKPQFKMYLDEELIERLTRAASRFSRESKQAVAEEVLRIYLPTWIAVNDSMRRAVEFQTQQNIQEGEQTVNGAMVRTDKTDNARPRIDLNAQVPARRTEDAPKKKNKRFS